MASTWISTYAQPLATLGAALLVVFGVPPIGAWAYFKRKEHETVRKRYLEDGVEKIIGQVEYGLSVFEYNWAHSIHLLRTYRDLGSDTPPRLYESGFVTIDAPVSLETSRHYLLKDLVGDIVFFQVHQLFTAFLHEADNFFRDDLCSAIKVSLEGGKQVAAVPSPKKIFDAYVAELAKKRQEAQSYYVLLGSLQRLASLLARKQYSFGDLNKFHDNPEVLRAIDRLKETFKDQLSKYASDECESVVPCQSGHEEPSNKALQTDVDG